MQSKDTDKRKLASSSKPKLAGTAGTAGTAGRSTAAGTAASGQGTIADMLGGRKLGEVIPEVKDGESSGTDGYDDDFGDG